MEYVFLSDSGTARRVVDVADADADADDDVIDLGHVLLLTK